MYQRKKQSKILHFQEDDLFYVLINQFCFIVSFKINIINYETSIKFYKNHVSPDCFFGK